MGALVVQGVPPEFLKREAIEAHVERLIALLDMLDGDVDLEPDNDDEPAGDEDEPSLGRPKGAVFRAGTGLDGREQDAGDEGSWEMDANRDLCRKSRRGALRALFGSYLMMLPRIVAPTYTKTKPPMIVKICCSALAATDARPWGRPI